MTDNTTPELLPCPFCGGRANSRITDIRPGYQASSVDCRECNATIALSNLTAVEHCNTRANTQRERDASEIARLREALEFYADKLNWNAPLETSIFGETYITKDYGNKARQALAQHEITESSPQKSGGE